MPTMKEQMRNAKQLDELTVAVIRSGRKPQFLGSLWCEGVSVYGHWTLCEIACRFTDENPYRWSVGFPRQDAFADGIADTADDAVREVEQALVAFKAKRAWLPSSIWWRLKNMVPRRKIYHDVDLLLRRRDDRRQRLLKLSEEASKGQAIDVTHMSDDEFFNVISRR